MATASNTVANPDPDYAQERASLATARAAWISYRQTVNTVRNGWAGYTQAQRVDALKDIALGQHELIVLLVIDRIKNEKRVKKFIQERFS